MKMMTSHMKTRPLGSVRMSHIVFMSVTDDTKRNKVNSFSTKRNDSMARLMIVTVPLLSSWFRFSNRTCKRLQSKRRRGCYTVLLYQKNVRSPYMKSIYNKCKLYINVNYI